MSTICEHVIGEPMDAAGSCALCGTSTRSYCRTCKAHLCFHGECLSVHSWIQADGRILKQTPTAEPQNESEPLTRPKDDVPNAEDLGLGDQGQSGG